MSDITVEVPAKLPRHFLPSNLEVNSWEDISGFLDDLKARQINSAEDLQQFLRDRSEISAFLEENLAWRYINMSCDTQNEDKRNSYEFFIQEISPNLAPYENEFNKKVSDSPFVDALPDSIYLTYKRSLKRSIELYREENIPLLTELATMAQQYGNISGAQTVEIDGKEMTLQQASKKFKSTDRAVREDAYLKVWNRRLEDKDKLNDLLTELIKLRTQVAKNAGYDNYRDYKHDAMGRFDYSVADCNEFHQTMLDTVVPLCAEFARERKEKLGYDVLKPWDLEVDAEGKAPLEPFTDGDELLSKGTECLHRLRPFFGERLAIMKEIGHLDLDSRLGKAPGGYNYPLHETGIPFIFMNAAGNLRDLVTLVHEAGHAVHSFLTRELEIVELREFPSEVAELASMSMELFSMDHWDLFFPNDDDLKRAKKEHMRSLISVLPWVCTVDKFQHWLYTNPEHTVEERLAEWTKIFTQYNGHNVDWTGHEDILAHVWLKQLHIYEVPFYYIEYGMAQLGAIASWRNFKLSPEIALDNYQSALGLGYQKPIGEIYKEGGIKFDFSAAYVKELMDFVIGEYKALG